MDDKMVEKIVSAPSVMLDKTIDASKQMMKNEQMKKAKSYWSTLGPGLVTGAADDDPSGVATYSQQGAQFGYQLLWLAPFTFPLMAVVQEMCGRIGIVTGRGLAANIRRHYPRPVIIIVSLLLLLTNAINLGADLGAMAKATQLLYPKWSFHILVVGFTLFMVLLQIFTTYERYARYLKWLAMILLAYVLSALSLKNVKFDQILFYTLIPTIHFSKDQLIMITAILGTTISPYLFFWQPSQEVEEKISKGESTIKERQDAVNPRILARMRWDVWTGMFISNLVMFSIVVTCASTLFSKGITNVQSAEQAALALRPIAGDYAYLLFALGIIGGGLLAAPILAGSAAYALSECFRWQHGLNKRLRSASAFYGVIIISFLVGLLMNFMGIDAIKALIYSAVLNGVIAPIVLFFIVKISSDQKIMNGYANHGFIKVVGWLVIAIMGVTAAVTILSPFF